MAEGTRPGGLTVLAVVNFVYGGLGVLIALLMVVGFALVNVVSDGEAADRAREAMEKEGGAAILLLFLILQLISYALLIVSGIGYLKQKRVHGRIIGSIYGILALISMGLMFLMGKEFEFKFIGDLVYPVLTLIMVNTTFKEDLVN